MKMLLRLLCLIILGTLLFSGNALAQQVSGTVRDASDGSVLPGVNITIKGTTLGTASALDGSYVLSVPSPTDTLVFSFVGYLTQEIPFGGRTVIDVRLVQSAIFLEEAVVIGYGTQRKVDITGSVAIVDVKDMRRSSNPSLEKALQGTVAGVAVTSSGAPGETPEVRIRGISSFGNNDPLYVIDGVPVADILDFNMADVESVQVLKDAAAAAIYGTRAAKGVVIITTRRGSTGGGLNVNYEGSVGVSNIYQRWDVLNRVQYQDLQNEMMTNAGQPLAPGNDPNSPFFISNIDTNWQEEALRPGYMTQQDLSISGGNEVSRFGISAGYLSQDGQMEGNAPTYERYSVRVNSDHTLGRLKLGESIYFSKSTRNRQESRHEISLVNNMLKAIPTMPVFDPNRLGGYGGADANIEKAITLNPIGVNNLIDSDVNVNRFLGNFWGQFEILEGLNYRINTSFDLRQSEDRLLVPQYDLGFFFTEQNGTLTQNTRATTYTLIENTLTYKKSIGAHDFTLLAGFTQEDNRYERLGGSNQGYPTKEFPLLSVGTETASVFQDKSRNTLRSQLGRIIYNYADKYLLTASVRRDGSSRFSQKNRYGVFPSVSVGWRISKESFFKNVPFVSDLKLRGSYGELGNQDIGNYATSAVINPFAIYDFGNALSNGAIQTALANSNLKWERATSFDVGLDATMFDAKLLFTADYYNNKNQDILLRVPIPRSVGSTANPTVNAATLRNWGLEFALTYQDKIGDFNFDISPNVTTWNNRVLSLGAGEPIFAPGSKTEVGGEVGQLYGYEWDGIFQTQAEVDEHAFQAPGTAPGDYRFKDLNADGVVNQDDRTYLGSAIPDFYYGITSHVSWKNWDLSVLLQGTVGNKIFNFPKNFLQWQRSFNNQSVATLNRWTPQNTDTDVARAIYLDPNNNSRGSQLWIEDGSYLRVQDVTIGFSLPQKMGDRIGASNVRVYFSGQNLLTLTGYTGLDPELGDDGDEVDNDALFSRGWDGGSWPHPRIFRIGAQVRF
jgi:TonB-dependent starch-binding outer membrane protein SusC